VFKTQGQIYMYLFILLQTFKYSIDSELKLGDT